MTEHSRKLTEGRRDGDFLDRLAVCLMLLTAVVVLHCEAVSYTSLYRLTPR